MKKNSNRSHRKNENDLIYFSNVSARSARKKKMVKDAKNKEG